MARFELRYLIRHPSRWLAIWWLHLTVVILLVGIAVAWTSPIFEPTFRPNIWPIAMGAVAALVLASSLAPFERKLQAATGTALIVIGLLRALAMVEVWFTTDAPDPLLAVLAIYALILSCLGVVWPEWTLACGTRTTVEAGREGMGG